MMDLLLSFAEKDERIRAATLEGSRANINISEDEFQDYDISYFVTDMESFLSGDDWLGYFGNIIMMQKPDDMELFPPQGKGYSYLMYFDDFKKVDLTLYPLDYLDEYVNGDKLVKVLIDKDGRIQKEIVPTDVDYHIKKPSTRQYDDCCNEFWFVTPYVVKGLCRREILFAIDHLNQVLRRELLRMISWNFELRLNSHLASARTISSWTGIFRKIYGTGCCQHTAWIPMKMYGNHCSHVYCCSGKYRRKLRKSSAIHIRIMTGTYLNIPLTCIWHMSEMSFRNPDYT